MAGLFGMFDPTKVGPGVSKNEPKKKRFFLFFEIYLRKFTKIVLLNLLYVAFCIPIITIGPATAGMTYCMRNFAREDHADISDFFDQFKKNFWSSILVWFSHVIGFGVIIFSAIFYDALYKQGKILGLFGLVTSIVALVTFLFMSYYSYVLIVTFKLTLKQYIKDCFAFAIVGLGRNIITTIILGVIFGWFFIYVVYPVVLPLFNPDAPAFLDAVCFGLAMYLFFIPSLASFIINFNVYPCIKKLMIDPTLANAQNSDDEEAVFEDVD